MMMENWRRQVQYVGQALQCSATLEDVSPSLKICHLAIPWCGRQLHWQILLPAPPRSAPDVLFDDDAFRPLCGSLDPSHPHERPGSTLSVLRSLLRGWPPVSAAASAAPPAAAAGGHPLPGGPPPHPERAPLDSLLRLVSVLLDAFREHQLQRLAAVAAGLPRLQFELSTLELGPGVQIELQQQQACLGLRLPALDLRRLLELAHLYGAVLPTQLQPPAGAAAAGIQLPHQHASPPHTAAIGLTQGGDSGVDPAKGTGLLDHTTYGSPGHVGSPGTPGTAAAAATVAGRDFTLLAVFRLPAGGGADVGDPELTLQLPRILTELATQQGGSAPGAVSTAATPGPGPGSSSSSGPSLVPAFMLPMWSPQMCLAEFVPMAVERLQTQLDTHCSTLAARQQLLDQLGELLGGYLELNLRGGSALYTLAWEGIPVLLSLELGARFPADKPTLVLQCLRVLQGAESSRAYRDYPWSPRWAPGEMAARIHNWLQEELPLFLRGRVPQS